LSLLVGPYTDTNRIIIDLKDSKRKGDSLTERALQHGTPQDRARSSGATSKPAVEVSAKGSDESVVRRLPAVTSRTSLSSQQF
jgi:hypothetical protein